MCLSQGNRPVKTKILHDGDAEDIPVIYTYKTI